MTAGQCKHACVLDVMVGCEQVLLAAYHLCLTHKHVTQADRRSLLLLCCQLDDGTKSQPALAQHLQYVEW